MLVYQHYTPANIPQSLLSYPAWILATVI